MNPNDKYVFQALDSYPHSLEETIESLDYALSYDENNTMALCLYGRLYSEQLQKYEEAKVYFQKALTTDIHTLEVYPYYLETLLFNEDYDEAAQLITFALTIKGINTIEIKLKEVLLYEMTNDFEQALALAKRLKLYVFNTEWNSIIDDTKRRIKTKIKIINGDSSSEKSSNSTEKEAE
ncbi:tetratricopeptide repeat protein [Zhouia sp. PK063]|uniref:tetratricopeptide repeat protein n=1 Tax=Zhouia sp. PK063 TaxID=3373602 RepID=UPI0037B899F9